MFLLLPLSCVCFVFSLHLLLCSCYLERSRGNSKSADDLELERHFLEISSTFLIARHNLKTSKLLEYFNQTMPICTRRSCGQEQDSNSPCVFHPGSPVFHEGQKSWSCCKEINKPVLEFDEFMKIKGCQTLGSHSSEKLPVEIPKAKDDGGIMKGMSIDKDGKEIYGNQSQSTPTSSVNITQPMTNMNLNSNSNSSSKDASTTAGSGGGSKEEKKPKELEQDPKDVDPTEGTVCKRSGCGKAFQGGKRVREEESCTFHRGSAIFHEGSKVSGTFKRAFEIDEKTLRGFGLRFWKEKLRSNLRGFI